MKVTVNLDACICSAYCIEDAPDVFAMGDNAILVLLNEHPDESRRSAVEQAVKDCPAFAITVS